MGNCAAVSFDGIDVVLNTMRMQGISTDLFTKLGIDPQTRKIVVVKSTQHFYDSFAPIAEEVLYVDSPGALVSDLTALKFTKLNRPKWPFDDDPFMGDA
jgi:microcystin degradation protein MlrC